MHAVISKLWERERGKEGGGSGEGRGKRNWGGSWKRMRDGEEEEGKMVEGDG